MMLAATPVLADDASDIHIDLQPDQSACAYPDSERGQAPDWLCDGMQFDGASYLAIGDKSRMPSISLQNRLAGKAAMSAVVGNLLEAARAQLASELPAELELLLPAADDWTRVARFKGIQVFDSTTSPRRHRYVLAGVPDADRDKLLAQARRELIKTNKSVIFNAVGKEGLQALLARP